MKVTNGTAHKDGYLGANLIGFTVKLGACRDGTFENIRGLQLHKDTANCEHAVVSSISGPSLIQYEIGGDINIANATTRFYPLNNWKEGCGTSVTITSDVADLISLN